MKKQIYIFLGFALLSTAIHAQQLQLKWQTPFVPTGTGGVVVWLGHPALSARSEFLVVHPPNVDYYVCDGTSYYLKYSFQIQDVVSVLGGLAFINSVPSTIQDYNGNGTRDLFFSVGSSGNLRLVDPAGPTVLKEFNDPPNINYDYFLLGLDDVDADGKLELLIRLTDRSSNATKACVQAYSTNLSLTSISNVTQQAPKQFHLDQNYPNPFNPTTTIRYSLPKESQAQIQIFNLSGQLVRTLLNEKRNLGDYSITWDGKTDLGDQAASGTYFYQVQIDGSSEAKKMLLLR